VWPWLGSGLLTSTGTVIEHFFTVSKVKVQHSATVRKVILPHFSNASNVMESHSTTVKEPNSF
jgi:hypothetical protein